MTLADRIREVLRAASGPMTAREVREALDDDSVTSANVASPLFAMCESGEVMREAPTESGSGTYLIDPSYVPKRAPKQDIAENVAEKIVSKIAKTAKAAVAKQRSAEPIAHAPAPKKRGRPSGSGKAKPGRKAGRKSAPPAKAIAIAQKAASATVTRGLTVGAYVMTAAESALVTKGVVVERGSLRTMALALMHLHPDPMPDGLKSAVLGAIESTL